MTCPPSRISFLVPTFKRSCRVPPSLTQGSPLTRRWRERDNPAGAEREQLSRPGRGIPVGLLGVGLHRLHRIWKHFPLEGRRRGVLRGASARGDHRSLRVYISLVSVRRLGLLGPAEACLGLLSSLCKGMGVAQFCALQCCFDGAIRSNISSR